MANKDKKNKTSFKPNNKEAEKWTLKETESFFNESLKMSEQKDIYFIGTIASSLKSYRQIYDYLLVKYPVFNTIKEKIDCNIENNLFLAGLTDRDISTPLAIFGLKNSHNWKDKTEVESNVTTDQDGINITVSTQKESDTISDLLNKAKE